MTPPRLPLELERIIFELAAWNRSSMSWQLIRVARRVKIWIEPLIYRVSLISNDADLQRLQRLLHDHEQSTYAKKHLHHLALSTNVSRAAIKEILSVCTNITDLALWTGDTYPALLDEMQALDKLTPALFDGPRGFQLPTKDSEQFRPFASLTHLDVFSSQPSTLIPFLNMLPALTHLSFTDDYAPRAITTILSTCERLRILMLLSTGDRFMTVYDSDTPRSTPTAVSDFVAEAAEEEIDDPRFCVLSCGEFRDDWLVGAWDGSDVWARGEERVATRANKSVTE
ncbi:hypothetical protein C8F01DRAFT_1136754 [Mycena amicta]|nr:hypothetical protein C8F01DRAFT_1136754 [Mycena amicta]